jgi:hypothetical protein
VVVVVGGCARPGPRRNDALCQRRLMQPGRPPPPRRARPPPAALRSGCPRTAAPLPCRPDAKHGLFSAAEKEALRAAVVEYASAHNLETSSFEWLFKLGKGGNKGAASPPLLARRSCPSCWTCRVPRLACPALPGPLPPPALTPACPSALRAPPASKAPPPLAPTCPHMPRQAPTGPHRPAPDRPLTAPTGAITTIATCLPSRSRAAVYYCLVRMLHPGARLRGLRGLRGLREGRRTASCSPCLPARSCQAAAELRLPPCHPHPATAASSSAARPRAIFPQLQPLTRR